MGAAEMEGERKGASEPLPCPFCGYPARLLGGELAQEVYSVWCTNPDRRHHLDGSLDEAETIAAWNHRSTEAALREEVERLREALAEIDGEAPSKEPPEHWTSTDLDEAFQEGCIRGRWEMASIARTALASREGGE